MARLEMVYLMKISLHLGTMEDIIKFEKVSKKCSIAIGSLKINPWFYKREDIEMFNKIFEPTTCNCNGFEINNSILLKAERIRNCPFGRISFEQMLLPPEEKEDLISIYPKIESLRTFADCVDNQIELLIMNINPNIRITCSHFFFYHFESLFNKLNLTKDCYPNLFVVHCPSRKQGDDLEMFDFIDNPKKNIICIWEGNGLSNEIRNKLTTSKVKSYISSIDTDLLQNNKNIFLMKEYGSNSFFQSQEEKLAHLYVPINEIIDENKRLYCFDFINKVYATTLNFTNDNLLQKVNEIKEIIKLPESVKHIIFNCILKEIKIPFSLEGIESLEQSNNCEINEKNDLKKLDINKVNGIIYFKKDDALNTKTEWGKGKVIDYFSKLSKLNMKECKNIDILNPLKNLEYLLMYKCESCDINIDSRNLKDIYLNCNNSIIKLKFYRNDTKFVISKCSFVDIEIECEKGIKPNIVIKSSHGLKIKSNNEMGNIKIEESNNISFKEGLNCELIHIFDSKLIGGIIEANVVRLINISMECPINLNKAKEISIVNMNNYIFGDMFESCKKLLIDECNDCNFDLGNNLIEEMKVLKCKLTNIEGTLPNIKSFVSIENTDCKIPITNNIITTDEEIIDLKENAKIVTDKKHLIIRNGKGVECEIESLIKTDITFENCHNFGIRFKSKLFGILEFNNCDASGIRKYFFGFLSTGTLNSLIVNNSKNLCLNVTKIEKKLKLKDSDLKIRVDGSNYLNVEQVDIENSYLDFDRIFTCKKCVFINSKSFLDKLIKGCNEELIVKRTEGVDINLSGEMKKIIFEDCSKIKCFEDVKGKEVKLIRCSDVKLKDTSNSIQMESCQNIEVETEQIQFNIARNPGIVPTDNIFRLDGFGFNQSIINQPTFTFGFNNQPFGHF